MLSHGPAVAGLCILFLATQAMYFVSLIVDFFFTTRHVDWVDASDIAAYDPVVYPKVVLLYPVLRELEDTMRTTFLGLAKLDYPRERYRIIAVPNTDDLATIESLERLQQEFPVLEILPTPPTSDASWDPVWQAWDANKKAYWWHVGKRAAERRLPPKKTRQLVYAFYTLARDEPEDDWLLDYIDADSVPPPDHFRAGAAGMERFDVVQSTNVAGNLLDSWAASWHAMDHMSWDRHRYPHLTARGKQPFFVLGKGLFFKASDLLQVGGFNPWLTIEDPEVGMRLWTNGKRLGVVESPLIEEVPITLREGFTQRKRWLCGFYQSLHAPLRLMGMTFWQRQRARMNIWPCVFLLTNFVGFPIGAWAFVSFLRGTSPLPAWCFALALVNIGLFCFSMLLNYRSAWRSTARVLDKRSRRLRFMWRVNPVFLLAYWFIWAIPILVGFEMFLRDKGQVWQRTEKIDANHVLVRRRGDPRTRAAGHRGLVRLANLLEEIEQTRQAERERTEAGYAFLRQAPLSSHVT
jgi:cellulose synthase/poly-beta-1,6-N-acetylglucosamine synthase-like glycosyltransferase